MPMRGVRGASASLPVNSEAPRHFCSSAEQRAASSASRCNRDILLQQCHDFSDPAFLPPHSQKEMPKGKMRWVQNHKVRSEQGGTLAPDTD